MRKNHYGYLSAYTGRKRGKKRLILLLIGLLVVCAGLFALWYFLLRAPAPISDTPESETRTEQTAWSPADYFWPAGEEEGPVFSRSARSLHFTGRAVAETDVSPCSELAL